ncbi:hypothetical protein C0991_010699, partial [Blastosporella zonata]
SAARFDAHVKRASSLAGRSKPIVAPDLQWIPALTPSQQTTLVLFSENEGDKMEDLLSFSLQQTLEPPERDHQDTVHHGPEGKDNLILVDFILDSDAGNGEEDTTGVVPVALFWVLPENMQEDTSLLDRLHFQMFAEFLPPNLERVLSDRTGRTYFNERSMAIMSSPG